MGGTMDEVKKSYTYEIDGIVYKQEKLKMGQINQIISLLKDVNIPADANAINLITALGDKLPKAIAIVLHVPDVKLKDKDIDILSGELEFEMSPELALEIIEDFFDLTPISSLLERVGKTVEKIAERMKIETGSPPLQS
jgi:hypothetical protein